ncbi:MAG TPA: helix-turn-helix domain-containing protein [Mycobacteriales bacterium]|nr:helix-turn-helix domain-containing protein [Mycobacteriales bacterium]
MTQAKPTAAIRRNRPVDEVRQGILAAAREQFRQYGYERSSLEQIGSAVGITRGAVLYHYRSKAELLEALLAPFVEELEAALSDFEAMQPRPKPRAVLEVLLDAMLRTRAAAELLLRDTSSRQASGLDSWVSTQADRLVRLLAPGSRRDRAARIRGLAALGALTRPLAGLPDPISAADRRAVLTAAGNALRPPRR